jgi:pimeloyl-ACP methyl ester carboxylesterase
MKRIGPLVVVLGVLLISSCTQATPIPPTATPVPPTPTPVLEGLVDLGGYRLDISCEGEGNPTVIFDSGFGIRGSDWVLIQAKIADLTQACSYDRVGMGKSDPYPKTPYTTQDMVDDLHKLLVNANIAGPYVLVAHSLAGLNARLYASQYPQDIVRMVLLDVAHPDQWQRMLAVLSPESPHDSDAVKAERQYYAEGYVDGYMTTGPEYLDWDTSAAQVSATGSLGSIPLVVITADQEPERGFPPELAENLFLEWVQMQEELAALSSNSTHIIVESSHMVYWDQWEIVVDTISDVVAQVRGE